ncbi:MAG: glycosyltransferase family 39 protein [bacterium]
MKSTNRILLTALIIFILALGVRFINLETIKDNPFFNYPIMDEKYHDQWAQEIAQGNLFGRVPYYRAPAYPYFLGLVYKLFGHSYYIPRLIGIIIGALSCMLIFLTGKEIFSYKIGALAGLLACFYSMFLYFDAMLLTVYLEIFFCVLALFLLIKSLKKRNDIQLILAGLFFGLASITRPTFLLCVLVFASYLYVISRKDKFKERLRRVFLLIIGVTPSILTVMIINSTIGKDSVPLAWNGGINFYLGNNQAANGWSATSPEIDKTWLGGYKDAIIIAELDMNRKLRFSEVSNYWFRRGFQYIFSRPINWFVLILKKAYLLVNAYEFPNNQSIKTYQSFSPLLRIPLLNFGIVTALAIIGFIFAPKQKTTKAALLFLLTYSLTIILFFVPARYRMPLIPLLLIFAAYAIFWIVQELRSKNYKKIVLSGGLIVLILGFVHTDLLNAHRDFVDKNVIHATYANHYFDMAQYEKALIEFNKALKYDPRNIKTINALGDTYSKLGNYDKARETYAISLRTQSNADALFKLGLVNFEQGIMDSAQLYFTDAAGLDSTNPIICYYAGMAYALDKKPQQAIRYLEISLRYHPYPRYISNTHHNIGLCYLEIGNIKKAKEHLAKSGIKQQDIDDLIK